MLPPPTVKLRAHKTLATEWPDQLKALTGLTAVLKTGLMDVKIFEMWERNMDNQWARTVDLYNDIRDYVRRTAEFPCDAPETPDEEEVTE